MLLSTLYVRLRALFKKGWLAPAPLLCALLATASGSALAQGAGQGGATELHRLAVRVDPPRFRLGEGRSFDEAELLRALSTRLSQWRLRVQPASEVQGPGAIWRLDVRARRRGKGPVRALSISFVDPEGRQVMLRRLSTRRYRPYDLAQTISLSTVESLIAVLDPVKFPGLVPPQTLTPMPPPTSKPASMPASAPVPTRPAKRPKRPAKRWAFGVELAGAFAVPGDEALGGLGLSARFCGRRLMTQLVINAWLPISASGEGYDLDVYMLNAYLGAGLRHRVGDWTLGATAGATLRLAAEDRRGPQVVEGNKWRASGGVGGRFQLARRLGASVEAEVFFGFFGSFPSSIYTLHGVEVLEIGSVVALGGLAVVLSP